MKIWDTPHPNYWLRNFAMWFRSGCRSARPAPTPAVARRPPLAALLFASAALVAAGCSCWRDLRGPGYGDETSTWAEDLRPESNEKRLAGFDERSRQIERNLGVR
jgi:hypothetical protein